MGIENKPVKFYVTVKIACISVTNSSSEGSYGLSTLATAT